MKLLKTDMLEFKFSPHIHNILDTISYETWDNIYKNMYSDITGIMRNIWSSIRDNTHKDIS